VDAGLFYVDDALRSNSGRLSKVEVNDMNDGTDSELTDFLKDEPETTTEDTTDVDKPEETAEQDDKGGEKTDDDSTTDDKAAESNQDDAGSPSEPENKDTGTVPIAALLDEREKRQAFEKQVGELTDKLSTTEAKPLPDVLDDQEGFVKQLESKVKSETQAVRIEVSQDMMRTMHSDYDEMEAKFVAMAKDNPDLISKMYATPLPAKFAYETAKKADKLADFENVEEWEAKKTAELKASIKAEMEAEAKAKAEKDADTSGALSPSIAAQRAAGSNGSQKPADVPDPLETTFNR